MAYQYEDPCIPHTHCHHLVANLSIYIYSIGRGGGARLYNEKQISLDSPKLAGVDVTQVAVGTSLFVLYVLRTCGKTRQRLT